VQRALASILTHEVGQWAPYPYLPLHFSPEAFEGIEALVGHVYTNFAEAGMLNDTLKLTVAILLGHVLASHVAVAARASWLQQQQQRTLLATLPLFEGHNAGHLAQKEAAHQQVAGQFVAANSDFLAQAIQHTEPELAQLQQAAHKLLRQHPALAMPGPGAAAWTFIGKALQLNPQQALLATYAVAHTSSLA